VIRHIKTDTIAAVNWKGQQGCQF